MENQKIKTGIKFWDQGHGKKFSEALQQMVLDIHLNRYANHPLF